MNKLFSVLIGAGFFGLGICAFSSKQALSWPTGSVEIRGGCQPSGEVLSFRGDFDGDRNSEIAQWTDRTGMWTIKTSQGDTLTVQWGGACDIPIPADYDGDGITEVAVWRPSNGNWYISTENISWANRGNTAQIVQWGMAGDQPLPGNHNSARSGDEIAVYRSSTGTCFISTQNLSWSRRGNTAVLNQRENCGNF